MDVSYSSSEPGCACGTLPGRQAALCSERVIWDELVRESQPREFLPCLQQAALPGSTGASHIPPVSSCLLFRLLCLSLQGASCL